MTDVHRLLREAQSILLVDWPSREVPDTLARRGWAVVAQEGPQRYVAYGVEDGEVQPCELDAAPDRADIVYAYRPVDEIDDVVALAQEVGARVVWVESSGSSEELSRARAVVEAGGLEFVAEPRIVEAVRGMRRVGQTVIGVVLGDLLQTDAEAIVNAANSELWMGGGVAGAIKRAAGSEVESEAVAHGPIQPGESIVTSAGRLPAPIRWVVHAATMGPDLRTSEDYIRMATASALAVAARAGAGSIAFPALGTGVGGFPLARAAEVMVDQTLAAAGTGSPLDCILFVVRSENSLEAFEDALGR